MCSSSVLLSIAYLAPVQYFTKFLLYEKVWLETHEHYSKQTYRNRCDIYSANGKLSLTIPVLKGNELKTLITDIKIDYNKKWQKLHLKGIESAYRSTPFFEFYIDELSGFYSKKYVFLFDFNMEILNTLLHLLDLNPEIKCTEKYGLKFEDHMIDMREVIHPKHSFLSDQCFQPAQYSQVFSEKHGFIANLSIIDLIFNMGPDSISVLRGSIKPWSSLESSKV
jgi:hypothetical protein